MAAIVVEPKLQAQIPVFTESSSYVPLWQVTATDNLTLAKFGHLYPTTAATNKPHTSLEAEMEELYPV